MQNLCWGSRAPWHLAQVVIDDDAAMQVLGVKISAVGHARAPLAQSDGGGALKRIARWQSSVLRIIREDTCRKAVRGPNRLLYRDPVLDVSENTTCRAYLCLLPMDAARPLPAD